MYCASNYQVNVQVWLIHLAYFILFQILNTSFHSVVTVTTKQRIYSNRCFKDYKTNYLLSIVPSRNPGPQPNTRTRDNLPMLLCKTTLYYNSFFPSCIRAWNNLQRDLKEAPSVELFRQTLFKHFSSTYVPVFYYSGPRNLQIMHTRLRTQCSALNSHLFNKNIVNSPLCLCRSEETSKHFLLHCPRYENQRFKMLNALGTILADTPALTITTDLLLSGSEHLSVDKNTRLFDAVIKFIGESKRFGN